MPDKTPVFKSIPLNSILPSRHQPRTVFDEEGLEQLAQSIKNTGIESPFKVREVPVPDPLPEGITPFEGKCYEQLFGGRRLKSAKKAGVEMVWVVVVKVDNEKEAAMSAYAENTMREELGPLDEAAFFQHLKDIDPELTSEKLAADTCKSAGYISQSLGFLELSKPVKDKFSRLNFSRSHILELMRLTSDDLKLKAAEAIAAKDLSRESTRQLVNKMLSDPDSVTPSPLAGEGGGEGGVAKAGSKTRHSGPGIHIAKAGKNMKIELIVPLETATDAIGKSVIEACQKFKEEQAQAEQAKPTPESLKAARDAERIRNTNISQITKKLASLKTAAKEAEKGGVDPSAIKQEIEKKQAELKALKANGKALNNTNPNDQIPNNNKPASSPLAGVGYGTLKPADNAMPVQDQSQILERLKTLKEGGSAAVTAMLESRIATMKQALANPQLPDDQKASLNEAIKRLQAQIDNIRNKPASTPSPSMGKGGDEGENAAKTRYPSPLILSHRGRGSCQNIFMQQSHLKLRIKKNISSLLNT